jgi:hypothetical protein
MCDFLHPLARPERFAFAIPIAARIPGRFGVDRPLVFFGGELCQVLEVLADRQGWMVSITCPQALTKVVSGGSSLRVRGTRGPACAWPRRPSAAGSKQPPATPACRSFAPKRPARLAANTCPMTIATTGPRMTATAPKTLRLAQPSLDHQHRGHDDRPVHGPVDDPRTARRAKHDAAHQRPLLRAEYGRGRGI